MPRIGAGSREEGTPAAHLAGIPAEGFWDWKGGFEAVARDLRGVSDSGFFKESPLFPDSSTAEAGGDIEVDVDDGV